MIKKFSLQRWHHWWAGDDQNAAGAGRDKYTCGTLRYTPSGLIILFGWLLWGDFTYTLMESMPSLLVMQLKDHGVSNQAMAVLLTMIVNVLGTTLAPVVSYSSDRFRSRWGRRRPFLMFATPFITLFLLLIPWSPEITAMLLKINWVQTFLKLFPTTPLVLVFGVLIVLFQIFNMFISTVYYYLIPDTVPEPFIGRFYGWFRLFGILASLIFNWFVYGHAHAHMRLLFAVFAGLYAVSFTLMCWRVREGEYPDVKEGHGHWFSPIKNYMKECFTHRRFWLIFLVYAAVQWSTSANIFTLLFYRDEIGLTETEFGRLVAIANILILILSVPFGTMVDRLGSQKSLMIGLSVGIIISLLAFFMIHSRMTAFILGFAVNIAVFMAFISFGKWTVDMYPRAQYGQFASAAVIISSIGIALFSPLIGKLADLLGNYYRLCLIVPPIGFGLSLIASIVLYRWKGPGNEIMETVNDEEDYESANKKAL